MNNYRELIVVGGGAAGLYAAGMLTEEYNVTIIEARSDLGGRIRTGTFADGGHFEAGAEFLHGKLPITLELLDKAGLQHITAEGKMLRKEGKNWKEQDEMIENWDQLIRLMKKQDPDITLSRFLAENFGGDEYAAFRRHINQFAEGFDVADPERVSVRSLYKEWASELENYRIAEGYGKVVELMEKDCIDKGCRIIKEDAVRQIDWSRNEVTVYTSSGKKYNAQKALVTIPISLYSDTSGQCSINFTPPIDNYVNASLQIGFGTVIKIILKFKESFWGPDTAFVLSDESIPTWWTQFPIDNNSLTGWAGGPIAERISQHTDEELIQISLRCISNIFEIPVERLKENLIDHHVFNWRKYEEIKGAYSYSTPASKEARELLNTPLEDTVYFAGEALYEGEHAGTVEAAFISGKQAAERILAGS